MKINQRFMIIFVSLLLACVISVNAQKGIGNLTGIGQETEKPPIVSLSGELVEIKTGPCENTTGRAYIGTHLYLKSAANENLLNIHLGAAYAVELLISRIEVGQKIEVLGFRMDQMQTNHYIAKEVTSNGYTIQLRDDDLRPFWAGERISQRSRQYDTRRRGRW
jgi:hypothetical protein